MHRENNQIIASACLAHRAGERLTNALKSWTRELRMELHPDLSGLVGPLKKAYEDAKALLFSAGNLTIPPRWEELLNGLLDVVQAVAVEVTEPWRKATESGVPAQQQNLFKKWKLANPLQAAAQAMEQWSLDLRKAWVEAAPQIVCACLPAPIPRDGVKFFIASSSEGEDVARSFMKAILDTHPTWEALFWAEVFPPGESALETLQEVIGGCHFGVYVMTADDQLIIRKESTISARGNVLFEYGIGVGCHGRKLSFVVHDDIYTISDLKGITTIPYKVAKNPAPAAPAPAPAPSAAPAPGMVTAMLKFLWTKPEKTEARVKHLAPDAGELTRVAGIITKRVDEQISRLEREWNVR